MPAFSFGHGSKCLMDNHECLGLFDAKSLLVVIRKDVKTVVLTLRKT